MKLTPYSIVILAMVVLLGAGITAGAEELTITGLKSESTTTTGEKGTSTELEWRIDYTPNAEVDPTTGDFELICVDGKTQLRLTIPPWAFERNAVGGWSIIDPSDPKAMGITMVVLNDTGEHEISTSTVDADVSSDGAHLEHGNVEPVKHAPIPCERPLGTPDPVFIHIGDVSGSVSVADPGTSNREFKYLPDVPPQSGFIALSDESRITRNDEATQVEYALRAEIAAGGAHIDPTQDGVRIMWEIADGLLTLQVPNTAFEKKFLSFDQKNFRYQVIDPDFPELLGVKLIFEDGSQTELFPSFVDVKVTPAVENTWRVETETIEAYSNDDGDNLPIRHVRAVSSGPFQAAYDEHDFGRVVRESEFRPKLK